jgi:hypothetical protein
MRAFDVMDRVGFNFGNDEEEGWVLETCCDGCYLIRVDGVGNALYAAKADEMWHLPDQKCAACGVIGPLVDSLNHLCEQCFRGEAEGVQEQG